MDSENGIINCPQSLDDIPLFGHEAQTKLERISVSMAEAMISNQEIDSFIEKYIDDLQNDVASLENEPEGTIGLFSLFSKKRFSKDYLMIIDGLDQLKTRLQLEQARQIKQMNVLKRLETMVQECGSCLESFVQTGNTFLQSSNRFAQNDLESFWQRFQQRVDDLSMSNIIAQQMLEQIKLLQQLSSSLADKLQDAVMHLIPLWRNQISLLYGVHSIKEDSETIKKEIKRSLRVKDRGSAQKLLELDQTIIGFLEEIQRSNKTVSANSVSFTDNTEIKKSTKDKKGENDEK